jgi:DNA polymerase-3 subunit gamma/tau
VGKTSAARILAKALNCEKGPTPDPCNRCSLCEAIAAGGDIDVLEIDGASNRGIEEVRALRQNATLRPSRARFKIYIIDEVHMLTREAFNALLKTLEEPPPHVKFIFCTTEPNKLPATILSRCQRFDFAGISPEAIARRLHQIVTQEGIRAQQEALEVIARRAGGSMRDAQSLLEQVLAFGSGEITLETVRELLGLASEEVLARLLEAVVAGNAAASLQELDRALAQGMDLAVLMEQLAGSFRDLLIVAAGCGPEMLLYSSRDQWQQLQQHAQRMGIDGILMGLQILDHALGRMRYSFQPRLVAELALVRLARLKHLTDLASWLAQLRGGGGTLGGAETGQSPEAGVRLPIGQRGLAGGAVGGEFAEPGEQVGPSAEVSPRGAASLVPEGGRERPTAASLGDAGREEASKPLEPQAIADQLRKELASTRQEQRDLAQDAPKGQREEGESSTSELGPALRPPESPTAAVEGSTGSGRQASRTGKKADTDRRREAGTSPLPDAKSVWEAAVEKVGGYTADLVRQYQEVSWRGERCLVVAFGAAAAASRRVCEENLRQFERALRVVVGRPVQLQVVAVGGGQSEQERPSLGNNRSRPSSERWRNHPLVRKAAELFDALPLQPEDGGSEVFGPEGH